MKILAYSRWNIDRLLKGACIGIAAAIGLFFLGWFLFIQLYPWEADEGIEISSARALSQSAPPFSYEAIGTGALTLNPHATYGWVSEIARDLVIIAYNSRPDISQKEASLLLSLKNTKEQKHLINGKTLFLDSVKEGDGFVFSDAPQAIWVKPILLDEGGVLVEVGRKLGSFDTPHSEEKGQFFVQPNPLGLKSAFNSSLNFAHTLKGARAWGQDLLLQKYGGREYQAVKEKFKLEFSHEGVAYACFVSSGDQLVWKGQEWKVVEPDDITLGHPVALVKAATAKGIEVSAWDETGYYPLQLSLPLEHPQKFNGKMDGMPTALRLRTATQVSCLLGKKRLILRQGDWALKTSSGWRILRKKEDIERCLSHRMRGELLIFDKLEKEQGRWVFKGHLFDEMRTQSQPLSLPIDSEKKTSKTHRKRKLPFATKSVLPLWFFFSDAGTS
ncbi:MAG: hypothetical protein K2P51_06500 [Rhabdochlamydiaceae bacterium]|nr:hypothetical protein [Rhabdochlamydiaceae bacterium]